MQKFLSKILARPGSAPEPEAQTELEALQRTAQTEALVWRRTPYYDNVEPRMRAQWAKHVEPMLNDVDFTVCLDLAAGHGRNTEVLRQRARQVFAVDVNQENIDFCLERFKDYGNVTVKKNDGVTLAGIDDASVTYVHCFDAMVHFDSDVIRAYLAEFRRILVPGGRGMCHHSNYTANPTGDFRENPGWRSFMSRELFMHFCQKEGLEVIDTKVIDWGAQEKFCKDSDCLTVFARPT